jgi:arylsulfatase A-like enzyme
VKEMPSEEAVKKNDIVFIMTDDMGYGYMSCYSPNHSVSSGRQNDEDT